MERLFYVDKTVLSCSLSDVNECKRASCASGNRTSDLSNVSLTLYQKPNHIDIMYKFGEPILITPEAEG